MPRRKRTQEAIRFLITDKIRRVANKGLGIVNKVVYERNDLSPQAKGVLQKMGDATITGFKFRLSIINALTTGFISALSNVQYDKLYHLFSRLK